MDINYVSLILGFLFLLCFFILSVFLVVGGKLVFFLIKNKINGLLNKEIKTPNPPPKKRKPRTKVRTISINPDEVDRVTFKKSS